MRSLFAALPLLAVAAAPAFAQDTRPERQPYDIGKTGERGALMLRESALRSDQHGERR